MDNPVEDSHLPLASASPSSLSEVAPPAPAGNPGMARGETTQPYPSRLGDETAWSRIGQIVRQHVVYPVVARRRGLQGRTTVTFVVDASGSATDLRVVESSGHQSLDSAALEAVARSAPLPSPAARTQIIVPIVFTLH
jgi:periplasmic protein TonB